MAEPNSRAATMSVPELDAPPAFEIEAGNSLQESFSKDSKNALPGSDEDLRNVNTGPSDPTLWPKWKKRRVLFVVCAYYFLFTFITTVTVPTFNDLQTYFVISYEQVTYTVAVPALALAVSPFFWTPLAEALGRRTVMILGCLVATLASLGVALETTYKGYMAFRFLQGWGVGPASTSNTIGEDIYLEHERGQKVGYWCLSIDIGLLFGPLIGGLAALAFRRFVFNNVNISPETASYPIQPPQYSAQPPTSSQQALPTKALPWLNFRTLLTRPKPWDSTLHFLRLFAFPNITITIIFYCWPGTGLFYALLQCFRGHILIIILKCCSLGAFDYLVQRAMQKTNGERVPEKRLLLWFPAALLTTIGLVLFGCTVQLNWHWFIAQIATFLIGTGIQIGNTTTISYVVDVYPQHVMDVTLFYTFHLNLSAFASPFFIVPWIERIGWAWCFGAQGAMVTASCLIFAPFLYMYGRWLRDWKGPIPWGNALGNTRTA
ncbi:mfs general substrate transporter [Rhizoctonia solani]|uniref:Mfs general substrate transporter n=1 Tax=Rhizoctonia solani TaxID=456999 RepID=A0A8H7IK89_9AGAM|nr:mfs general substrate transporter [Rhizoctonia solani]